MNSWKTTVLGVIAGLIILLPELNDLLNGSSGFDLPTVIEGFAAMGIGFFARDNAVTSEQAGAK